MNLEDLYARLNLEEDEDGGVVIAEGEVKKNAEYICFGGEVPYRKKYKLQCYAECPCLSMETKRRNENS